MVLGGRAVLLVLAGLALAAPGSAWADGACDIEATDGLASAFARVEISAPADGATFRVGLPVALRGRVAARLEARVDALRWTVVRHTGAHAETVAEGVGAAAAFTPSDRLGADTTYEIRLRLPCRGDDAQAQVTIVPEAVRLSLSSDPGGALLRAGSIQRAGDFVTEEPVGRRLTLSAAPSHVAPSGEALEFSAWSDGAEREREYVVPDSDASLIARYSPRGGTVPAAGESSVPQGSAVPGQVAAPAVPAAPAAPPLLAANAPQIPRFAISSAARASSPLPVLSFDRARRGARHSLTGWLRKGSRGMRVEVALRSGDVRSGCRWWSKRRARFSRASRGSCGRPRWVRASIRRVSGASRWRVSLRGRALRGRYCVLLRVRDADRRPVDVERG